MSASNVGWNCTLLLVATVAGLFGCMSALRCRRCVAFALCMIMAVLDFSLLAMLLSRLPTCGELSLVPWTTAALILTVISLLTSHSLLRLSKRQLSPISIKESCDHLPSALCFAFENGQPCLKNLKMDELSHQITGEALLNANTFWNVVEHDPIIALENGQTWSFERVCIEISGRTFYQITGMNVTEEARLKQKLEKDNQNLHIMNRRLRQYSHDLQNATREKEILRTKTRIHDDIGHALLQTRQFLSGTHGDAESVCAVWRQSTQLLLGKYENEQHIDTFEQLSRAAQAIGVTITCNGVFPERNTENAHLVETAAHECLTNLVRHANGTRLEVIGSKTTLGWEIR